MSKDSISFYYPDSESLQKTLDRLKAYRKARADVSMKVLGHAVTESDWILLDEMLEMDYKRMVKLLLVLDERAG